MKTRSRRAVRTDFTQASESLYHYTSIACDTLIRTLAIVPSTPAATHLAVLLALGIIVAQPPTRLFRLRRTRIRIRCTATLALAGALDELEATKRFFRWAEAVQI